jgi:hypothetical protein
MFCKLIVNLFYRLETQCTVEMNTLYILTLCQKGVEMNYCWIVLIRSLDQVHDWMNITCLEVLIEYHGVCKQIFTTHFIQFVCKLVVFRSEHIKYFVFHWTRIKGKYKNYIGNLNLCTDLVKLPLPSFTPFTVRSLPTPCTGMYVGGVGVKHYLRPSTPPRSV